MMNFTNLQNNLTRTFHRVGFQFKKHSPEILVGAGIIGGVASAVLACKATTKVNDILEETKVKVDQVHEVLENEEIPEEDYSVEDSKKDLAIIYVQSGIKLAKLYAPSVALGALSIASVLTGHNVMRKRNIALAAAYSVVDKGFKEYRGRVVERFGEALDRELKYNIKSQEIKEVVVDEETGKKKTVKTNVESVDGFDHYSDYARFFDDGCTGWQKDAELNLYFVKRQQDWANDLLKTKGHLFLNEVYDMFGIPRTKAGQVVGWVYDEKHPTGDNYIDFGIYDLHKLNSRDFVNGYERTILLDFNVDGNILDLI